MKQVNRKENERETERGGACAESKDVGVCVCVCLERRILRGRCADKTSL